LFAEVEMKTMQVAPIRQDIRQNEDISHFETNTHTVHDVIVKQLRVGNPPL
jgi:hypothetical protein